MEEFAAPEYAEDDWMAGVVDDATDDEDWDERESDDSPMKKGAKDFIRGMMSKRMDDRMDNRADHLEQRIAAGQPEQLCEFLARVSGFPLWSVRYPSERFPCLRVSKLNPL